MDMVWLDVWKLHGMALLIGCMMDWLIGDPRWMPHPVRLMGNMISWLETWLRRHMGKMETLAGLALAVLMCLLWWWIPWCLVCLAERWGLPHFWPVILGAEGFLCSQMLAARSLASESMKVCRSLEAGRVEDARFNVSMIVGRDTSVLEEDGITRAAVETVAENASDGVIAPLLFMALLGLPGGALYKAVNTMDSMIGYKNEKYLHFGRAAARLDDGLNFIPARVTGALMVLGAWLLPGMDGANAWKIFLRDRRKHASPNSAHGESACAGALHLRLAGDAWYFGVLHRKPYIGDEGRNIEPEDIRRAIRLMFLTEIMVMAALGAGIAFL